MLDPAIKSAELVDGTGESAFTASIGARDGPICCPKPIEAVEDEIRCELEEREALCDEALRSASEVLRGLEREGTS